MAFNIEPNSSGAQLKTFSLAMKGYFTALQAYLNSQSNPLPMFSNLPVFDFSAILSDAQQGQSDNASFTTGALVETVNMISAIDREFTMRQKTKSDYYSDAQNDYILDATYYDAIFGLYFALYRGSSIEGS